MSFQNPEDSAGFLDFWICGDPLPAATITCNCEAGHEWVVFSTALAEGWLMLPTTTCWRERTA